MSADFVRAGAQSDETPRSERPTCAAPSCWRDAETVRVGGRCMEADLPGEVRA